jgi:hypothetical protein
MHIVIIIIIIIIMTNKMHLRLTKVNFVFLYYVMILKCTIPET